METKDLSPSNWFKKRDENANQKDESGWDRAIKETNRIFEDFSKDFGSLERFLPQLLRENMGPTLKVLPRIDIAEIDGEYIVEADLPGVESKNLDIAISKGGVLVIKGRRDTQEAHKKMHYHKIERSYGSFERFVYLPNDCNTDAIQASFKDGILTIKISKQVSDIEEIKKIKIDQQ